jgi:hypothetical protein
MYYKKNFGDNKQIVHRQYVVGVLCVNGEKVRPHVMLELLLSHGGHAKPATTKIYILPLFLQSQLNEREREPKPTLYQPRIPTTKYQAMSNNQNNLRSGFGLLKKLQNSIRVFPEEVARTIDESRRGVRNRTSKALTTARAADAHAKTFTTRRAPRRDDRIGSELIVPSSDGPSLASDISEDVSVASPHDILYCRSLNSHRSDHELLVSFHCDSKDRETGENSSQSSFSFALEASFPTIGATVFYENFQDLEKKELNETGRNTTPLEGCNKNSTGGTRYSSSSHLQDSARTVTAADIKAVIGRGSRFRKKSYCRQNTRNTQKDVEEFLLSCENNHSFADEEDESARTGKEQPT